MKKLLSCILALLFCQNITISKTIFLYPFFFSLLNFSKLKSKLWVVLGPPKLPFEHPFLEFFFRIWRSSSHYCKTSSAACGQTTPPDGRMKLVDDSTRPKFSKNMIFCGARAHLREWWFFKKLKKAPKMTPSRGLGFHRKFFCGVFSQFATFLFFSEKIRKSPFKSYERLKFWTYFMNF